MRKGTKRAVRLTVLVFILASAVAAFKQPSAPAQGATAQAQEGQATKETLQKVCGTCHALDRVTSSRRSRAQWEETTDKMITLGAKATDEEFTAAIDYLVRHYGRVNVNTAPAAEIAEVVGLSDKESEALVKYRQEKGKFDSFEALSKAPGVAVEKLEKSRDAISF
jgi:competence protein ComEA